MKRTALLSSLTALALVGGTASSSDAANLVTNGDFESGNTGFSSNFTFSSGDLVPAATYDIVEDPNDSHGSAASYADNTTGTGLMLAANGSTSTDTVIWSQEITVTPGTPYNFSLWTSTWFSDASLEILINSNQVGPSFTTPDTTGIWEQTSREWNSGLTTTATIEIVNTSTGFTGNDFALDDISFTSVPEPSSGVLLFASSILAFRRRRASSQSRRQSLCHTAASRRTAVPVAAATFVLATPLASADVIPKLFNTGVDDSSSVRSIGEDETHYSVTGPSTVNESITPNPAWVTSSSANWIGPVSGSSNAPVGTYEYDLTFDLTGFNLTTIVITGEWASDNDSEVLLNGQATGLSVDTLPFQELTPLLLDSGFLAGENTLTFQVTNFVGFSPNPAGLLVTNLEGTGEPVPEPASAAALIALGVVTSLRRRR